MNFRASCKMTPWTKYSPCNAKCGKGVMIRTRLPLHKEADVMAHHRRVVKLYNRKNRHNMDSDDNSNERETEEQDVDLNDNRLGFGSVDPNDPCQFEKTVEEVVCGRSNPECDYDVHGLPRELKMNIKLMGN